MKKRHSAPIGWAWGNWVSVLPGDSCPFIKSFTAGVLRDGKSGRRFLVHCCFLQGCLAPERDTGGEWLWIALLRGKQVLWIQDDMQHLLPQLNLKADSWAECGTWSGSFRGRRLEWLSACLGTAPSRGQSFFVCAYWLLWRISQESFYSRMRKSWSKDGEVDFGWWVILWPVVSPSLSSVGMERYKGKLSARLYTVTM